MNDINDPLANKHINEAVRPLADRIVGLLQMGATEREHYIDVVRVHIGVNGLALAPSDVLDDGSTDGRTKLTKSDLAKFWDAWDAMIAAIDLVGEDHRDAISKPRVNINLPR